VLARGKILRFDQVKGYGFVAPHGGGEDVFLHANDLLDEKHLMRAGAIVEFEVEQGDRGPKASSVHLVTPAPTFSIGAGSVSDTAGAADDMIDRDEEFVDVLSRGDFSREVTEALLLIDPGLTGPQIRAVRERFSQLAKKYGWIGR